MVQLLGLQGPWWCQALRESGSHGDGRYRHEIWFTSITYSGELVWLSGIRRACLCSFNSIQTATDQPLHSWQPQMPPSLVPTNCSDVGISPLLQLPRSQVQVSPAHPLLFPFLPSSYWVLCGPIYSFLLVTGFLLGDVEPLKSMQRNGMIPLTSNKGYWVVLWLERGAQVKMLKILCGQERMKYCSKAVSMERSSQEIKIWPFIVARNQTELYQKLSLLMISCVALGKLLKPSEALSSWWKWQGDHHYIHRCRKS